MQNITPTHPMTNPHNIKPRLNILAFNAFTSQELSVLFLQISIMLKAHLPLLEVIEVCAKNTKTRISKQILLEIAYRLNLGQKLSAILEEYRHIFGNLTWNMVALGEKSGNLGEIFAMLSTHFAIEHKNKGKIKRALFYPSLVLLSIVGAFVGIILFVLPHFLTLFADFNASLPIYTRILINIESFVRDFWLFGLELLGVMIITFFMAYTRFFTLRFKLHALSLHLPFIGEILKMHAFYQFAFTLSLQLKSSIPLDTALSHTHQCIQNLKVQQQTKDILESIQNGKAFSSILAEINFLDDISLALINAGEKSVQLPEMLSVCAQRFQEDSQEKMDFLISLVEPILSLLMGALLLFLALGVFVPMWDMSSSAMGGM